MADYLTIEELAAYLRTTPRAVRRWRELGQGPVAARVGARLLFERTDVDAWVASRKEVPVARPLPPYLAGQQRRAQETAATLDGRARRGARRIRGR